MSLADVHAYALIIAPSACLGSFATMLAIGLIAMARERRK